MSNLQARLSESIAKLQKDLHIAHPMAVPKLLKIVVNMGVSNAIADKKNVEKAAAVLAQITGQKPKITKAKQSISSFKLREGDKIGAVVTLRGKRMYDFFEKLVSVVLPRLKDFHGVPAKSFDTAGNYTLGFSEFVVFPEIDPGKIDPANARQGLEIIIVTTARNRESGYALLKVLGMPFQKN